MSIETAREQAMGAVTYLLNRAQTDADFGYHFFDTEGWRLCCQAEAELKMVKIEDVMKERRKDLQPAHRRYLPRLVVAKKRLEAATELLAENEIDHDGDFGVSDMKEG